MALIEQDWLFSMRCIFAGLPVLFQRAPALLAGDIFTGPLCSDGGRRLRHFSKRLQNRRAKDSKEVETQNQYTRLLFEEDPLEELSRGLWAPWGAWRNETEDRLLRGQVALHANKNEIKLTEGSAGESKVAVWKKKKRKKKKQGANNEAKSPTAFSCVMNVELIYFPCSSADFCPGAEQSALCWVPRSTPARCGTDGLKRLKAKASDVEMDLRKILRPACFSSSPASCFCSACWGKQRFCCNVKQCGRSLCSLQTYLAQQPRFVLARYLNGCQNKFPEHFNQHSNHPNIFHSDIVS